MFLTFGVEIVEAKKLFEVSACFEKNGIIELTIWIFRFSASILFVEEQDCSSDDESDFENA